jgi:hypothetical protein
MLPYPPVGRDPAVGRWVPGDPSTRDQDVS